MLSSQGISPQTGPELSEEPTKGVREKGLTSLERVSTMDRPSWSLHSISPSQQSCGWGGNCHHFAREETEATQSGLDQGHTARQEPSFIWLQCECFFLEANWLSKFGLRQAVSAALGNLLDMHILSPSVNCRSGTEASVFQQALQVILTYVQVPEPLLYAMGSLFN